MTGQIICNDKHIRKRKLQEKWTLDTTEIFSEADAELDRKDERNKEVSQRIINIQHVAVNDMK